MKNYNDVFATLKSRQAIGRAKVNARQDADASSSIQKNRIMDAINRRRQLQRDADATKRANLLISRVQQGTPPAPAVFVPVGTPIQQVNSDGTPIQDPFVSGSSATSAIAAAIAAKILEQKLAAAEAVKRAEEIYQTNLLVGRGVETPIQQVNPNGTPIPHEGLPQLLRSSVVPVDASRDPGYVAPLANRAGGKKGPRHLKGLGWSVFNPRPDERDMVPREMILNNISGVFLSAPPGSKFYVRTDDTLAKFNDLARRAAALGQIQSAVYDKIMVENHLDRLLLKMEEWKQSGKGHTGALSSAKVQLEALEAVVKNMESDVSKRAYDEQLVVSRKMFENALGMYNRDATTAATQPARPTGNRYNYYGYNPILHVRGNRPPVLKGLGMFRLGAMGYNSFLDSFATTVNRYNSMSGVVTALGKAALTAFTNLVNQPLGSGRTAGGGMLSGMESIRFDIKHNPGTMDTNTLNALNTKLDVLDKVVVSMQQSPPAETQDGENERALEYMKSEVDKALIEKNAALASAAKWGWLAAPLGVSWTLWGIGGAGLTALVGVTYAVGRSR